MGMRVTTGMMMNTYRFNLQGSTTNLSDARNKVLTHRKFDSYKEDPASATMAWRIRRAMYSNNDYQTNNKDTYSRFNIAWTTMGVVNNQLSDENGRFSAIRANSDSTGGGRQPLGQVLSNGAETIIQAINSAKYGDHFVFSGSDEMTVPFSWSDDMKTLYYRGINVGAGKVEKPELTPDWVNNPIDENTGLPAGMPTTEPSDPWGKAWHQYYTDQAKQPAPNGVPKPEEVPAWTKSSNPTKPDPANAWDEAWATYLANPKTEQKPSLDPAEYDGMNLTKTQWGEKDEFGIPSNIKEVKEAAEKALEANPDDAKAKSDLAWVEYYLDQGDLAKLKKLSEEEQNIDLGMGLQEDKNGKLVNGSAFNRSLPGINMLGGYGFDEDGDPKNIVLIMKRLGELCTNCDPESGEWASEADSVEANRLLDKVIDCRSRTTEALDEIDTRAHFLKENQARLEEQGDYLQEERANIEDVDLADALTEFSWDYYCYSAALKIGTQLLSQSLLDYMG